MPDKPTNEPGGQGGGMPPDGGGTTGSASYTGASTISGDDIVTGATYESATGGQNALLISGGNVELNNFSVTKSGDSDGDSADFYGTNAGILAINDAKVDITGLSVNTNGKHANAVFAYGNAVINIDDSTINTTADNSGGIMVTGGGTINATDVTVATTGRSSASIRSDRGGGTINVNGGSYQTSGVGSPAIYSTADIYTTGTVLESTASEGVVIEGKNSVTLDRTRLTATNNQLNGQSETYKTVFIYQSMSGDASEGTGTFSATDSLITSNQGDIFFVTNTDAKITLSGNRFIQNDTSGAFLRASKSAWGNSGSNGGKVTLSATDQEINGDIAIDSISSLTMSLEHSYFKGVFTGEGAVSLTVSEDSIIVLTGDSKISSLTNADSSNSNIYANGHKLYVNGQEATINEGEAPESFLTFDESVLVETDASEDVVVITPQNSSTSGFPTWGYFAIGGGVITLIIIVAVAIFAIKKGKKKPLVLNEPLGQNISSAPVQTPAPEQEPTPGQNPEQFGL